MSAPEAPEKPLCERNDRLGALIRDANAELEAGHDQRAAQLRLEERLARRSRPTFVLVPAFAAVLALGALHVVGSTAEPPRDELVQDAQRLRSPVPVESAPRVLNSTARTVAEPLREKLAQVGTGAHGSSRHKVGEAAQAPTQPLRPAAARPAQDCAELVREQALLRAAACYAREAEGEGLGAELALFELARLRSSALEDPNGAVSALEEHQRRFKSGALASQVELALVRALAAARRHPEAIRALAPLIARGGPKQAELRMLRAELHREQNDCARALEDYSALLAEPSHAGEARSRAAECREQLESGAE